MSLKAVGRIIAALLLSVTAGIVAFAVYTSYTEAPDPDAPRPEDLLDDLPATIAPTSEATALTESSIATQGGLWTSVNPRTDQLEFRLTWDSLEPLEGGSLLLKEPEAWLFQDGTAVRVTAGEASVLWPDREREPESGLLESGVTIDLFEPPSKTSPSDFVESEDLPEPLATLSTDNLSFQTTLMELTAPQEVVVTASGVEARGTGLSIRINEADRRLKVFRVDEFTSARIVPALVRTRSRPGEPAGEARAEKTEAPPTAAPGPPAIDLYHTVLSGHFTFEQAGRALKGEQLDLFTRFIGGKLPEDALAPLASDEHDDDPDQQRAAAEATAVATRPRPEATEPINISGSGPIVIRPLRAAPPELEPDHLFVRIQAPKSNRVTLTDAPSGAYVHCVSLEYAASARRLSALGLAGSGVVAHVPDTLEAVVGRFDQNLTTGEGSFPGPGTITLFGDRRADRFGDADGRIRWQQKATFSLDTALGPVGAEGRFVPEFITFHDRVEGTWSGHELRGDTATATFASSDTDQPLLESVQIDGNATIRNDRGARAAADSLRVEFETPPGSRDPYPTLATASGNVYAEEPRGTLAAEHVEIAFAPPIDGRIEPAEVRAELAVSVTAGEDVTLEGDRLLANLQSRTLDVHGTPAIITQLQSGKRQFISGDTIHLEERSRRIDVPGPGQAMYSARRAANDGFDRVKLEWNHHLTYDDLTGFAEIEGDPVITAERTEAQTVMERHVGTGRRITVHRAPYTSFETENSERQLIRAELHGASEDDPAELDLRRYLAAEDPLDQKRIEGLINLRGPRIVLDAQTRRLIVPDPGTLLIEDRRENEAPDSAEPGQIAGANFPGIQGTTGFWWRGSLVLEEKTGRATLDDRVRMVHLARDTGVRTELECEQLTATITTPDPQDPASLDEPRRLSTVTAAGAVFVRHGAVELVADELDYDARTSLINAEARSGNRITVHDADRHAHFVAEAVSIDTITGEWQITRGAGAMTPR